MAYDRKMEKIIPYFGPLPRTTTISDISIMFSPFFFKIFFFLSATCFETFRNIQYSRKMISKKIFTGPHLGNPIKGKIFFDDLYL